MKLLLALMAVAACTSSGKKVTILPVTDEVAADAPALVGGETLQFEAGADATQVTVVGTYLAPDDPATRGCVVFAHQLSSTRVEWAPVIDALRGRAHLYAIDLRGHGASTKSGAATISWKGFGASDWEAVEHDLAGALDAIAARGAGPRCVVVGASIGSSAVARLAGAAPDRISAVVLLSPGLAYRGLATPDAVRAIQSPVLIVHSQERGAVDAATALANLVRDRAIEVEVIADPGTAHGMKIVAGDRAILDRVVGFIAAHLGG